MWWWIYSDVPSSAKALSVPQVKTYVPNEDRGKVYDSLYEHYAELYDYFGRKNKVMKVLSSLRRSEGTR